MRTTTRRAAVLAAAGVLGLGGIAVAAPALAGAGPFAGPPVATATGGPGWSGGGMGYGMGGGGMMGAGAGMMGAGAGGCLDPAVTAAKGTLTDRQKTTLVAMAQEEKTAQDLYAAFAGQYDAVVFDRIAAAEARHLAVVRTLLTRYGVADPTAGRAAGQFSDTAVQATYDKLLAQGKTGRAAALRAGVTVEQTDIADLTAALDGLTAPDVTQVYTQLRAASRHHLAAFQHWSTR
jgi:hypothetical protein